MMEPVSSTQKIARMMLTHPVVFLLVSLIPVYLITNLILLVSGVNPHHAYHQIILGSLSSWVRVGHVIKAWIPLTLCSIGLVFTFRINLWNIGVEGQMMIGAVFAMTVLRLFPTSGLPVAVLVISMAASMMGGALWALVAGFLKTKGGVNEIFAGLGLNFVAQGWILWLIFGPWKRPGVASMSGTEMIARELWLSLIKPTAIPASALVLTVLFLLLSFFLVHLTRIGLAFQAIGLNPSAARLYGLRPVRYMMLALCLGGGLAGMAGAIQVTGVYHRLIPSISSNYGYLALLVVMLSGHDIRVVPVVSLIFACLNVGSIQLPMVLGLDSSLGGVIQGSLVLTFIALHALRRRLLQPTEKQ
ncbi:ABC transporter permease [Desulfatiferula olefinivorans]